MVKVQEIFKKIKTRNNFLINDKNGFSPSAKKNCVNLNWWHIEYNDNAEQNLGDMLSEVVFDFLCQYYNIDKNKPTKKTKHLFAIGSILYFGLQDSTVWGTGSLFPLQPTISNKIKQRLVRKLDIRAVRGPKTRDSLMALGIRCPDVYGDPALLLPLFYTPCLVGTKDKVLVIPHFEDNVDITNFENVVILNMKTKNWKQSIDLIASAKLVISSSLHGIIIAESYGVPALFLCTNGTKSIYKYEDYYYSTGRYELPIVNTIEDGLKYDITKIEKIDFSQIQKKLIDVFPRDLWK